MKTTDKINLNAGIKYANDLLSYNNEKNVRKESSLNALGLLIKIALLTGIRVSDILSLEYSQFTEDKIHPNTFSLTYWIKKSKKNNTVPIGAELMSDIEIFKMSCLANFNYTSNYIFQNYQTNKLYSRVWASSKIATANKNGKLGEVVNVAGSHSLRKTIANDLFDKTQDLKLVQSLLGHKNILTTSIYLKDAKKSTQDKLREHLC